MRKTSGRLAQSLWSFRDVDCKRCVAELLYMAGTRSKGYPL